MVRPAYVSQYFPELAAGRKASNTSKRPYPVSRESPEKCRTISNAQVIPSMVIPSQAYLFPSGYGRKVIRHASALSTVRANGTNARIFHTEPYQFAKKDRKNVTQNCTVSDTQVRKLPAS